MTNDVFKIDVTDCGIGYLFGFIVLMLIIFSLVYFVPITGAIGMQ